MCMHVVKVEFDTCSHNAGMTPTGLVWVVFTHHPHGDNRALIFGEHHT